MILHGQSENSCAHIPYRSLTNSTPYVALLTTMKSPYIKILDPHLCMAGQVGKCRHKVI